MQLPVWKQSARQVPRLASCYVIVKSLLATECRFKMNVDILFQWVLLTLQIETTIIEKTTIGLITTIGEIKVR